MQNNPSGNPQLETQQVAGSSPHSNEAMAAASAYNKKITIFVAFLSITVIVF